MKRMKRVFLVCLLLAALCFVFAACSEDGNKITFRLESDGTVTEVLLDKDAEYTLPEPEAREGYSFEGWYLTPDFTGDAVVTPQKASRETTFYAKWEKLYRVTLELAGGTLSESSFYLKAGENLGAAAKERVPVRENFEFGEWRKGSSVLGANEQMPAEDVTLTARWKVRYTVEVFEQDLDDLTKYDRAEDVIGYAYADGNAYTPDLTRDGFLPVSKSDSLTSRVLSEEAPAQNVYRVYYDRDEIIVYLDPASPAGEGPEPAELTGLYGETVELPSDSFSLAGYCLLGWSESLGGEVSFPVNTIERHLFGAAQTDAPKYTLTKSGALYGVWLKGASDNFGGGDYIYRISDTEIYLERGGVFFQGVYTASNGTFQFNDENGDLLLEGKLAGNNTYTYLDQNRATSAVRFTFPSQVDEDVKLVLDALDGLTYSDGGAQSSGTYFLYEDGITYEANFTSGPMSGQKMVFTLGRVSMQTDSGEVTTVPAFNVRNETEYALGPLTRFVVNNGALTYYLEDYYALTLDGFYTATLNEPSSSGWVLNTYTYYMDGDRIELSDPTTGASAGSFMLIERNGMRGYMSYSASLDVTFTDETTGATLTLDGICNAEFEKNGVTVTGIYTVGSSVFGGYIVTVTDGEDRYKFLANRSEETVGEETVYTYYFSECAAGYGEFYYKDDTEGYRYLYTPLIVLDATQAGELSVYGRDSSNAYVKVADGSYVLEDGLFHATLANHYEAEGVDVHVDLSAVKGFVFSCAAISSSTGSAVNVTYWYSVIPEEGEPTRFDKVYHSKEGEDTLTLVASFAVYTLVEDGETTSVLGSYNLADNVLTFAFSGSEGIYYLVFELDESAQTFDLLGTPYGTIHGIAEDGSETDDFMTFDGRGGAEYNVVTPAEEEGGDNDVQTYTGSYASKGEETFSGAQIYTFTADGMTFDFILVTTGTDEYYCRFNENYNGEYTSADGATLQLDGYGFRARYATADGFEEGMYYIDAENVVCFLSMDAGTADKYFDLSGRTFTLRGAEAGAYCIYDNQSLSDRFLELNGYGSLTVYTTEGGERQDLFTGTYELHADGYCTLNYDSKTVYGRFGAIVSGNYLLSTFFVSYEETNIVLVNGADHTVLVLDGMGNAVRYNTFGREERGQYVLVTESVFYYVNLQGTDAALYRYDLSAGTAVPFVYPSRGYYTSDLQSMRFYEQGFMIFEGDTRYYYEEDADGNVTIYYRDDEADPALTRTKYGFIAEQFGTFDDKKEWKGKTYYATNGYALNFSRKDGSETFPVSMVGQDGETEKHSLQRLTFIPGGGTVFTVTGTIAVSGQDQTLTCYVSRTVDDDGTPSMTLMVGNLVFDITLTYTGENELDPSAGEYDITAMRMEVTAPSERYYELYVLYAYFLGIGIRNTFGTISVVDTYNETGDVVTRMASADFGASSGVADTEGTLISFENVEYTRESNGLNMVEYTAPDGYVYRLHFGFSNRYAAVFGTYSYVLYAATRVETLDLDGGYKVEIERVIASEYGGLSVGGLYKVDLYHGEEHIDATEALMYENTLYYIVRQTEEEGTRYVSAEYYILELEENTSEGDDDSSSGLATYKGATLTQRSVTTVYGGSAYADIYTDTDDVAIIVFGTEYYIGETTEKDDENYYRVTTVSGKQFYIDLLRGMIGMLTDAAE